MSKFWRVGFGRFGLIIFCRIAELLAVFALSGAGLSMPSSVGVSSLFMLKLPARLRKHVLTFRFPQAGHLIWLLLLPVQKLGRPLSQYLQDASSHCGSSLADTALYEGLSISFCSEFGPG